MSTEAEIEKEVNKILYEKEKLLSLTDEKGNYNTTRFIFSKWTLKEGWDNPNIFTIAKLRSSGSDNSKLQEIGRGLRLPVDETGNRIENESFTLNYIVDFTEKDFVNSLEKEIYGESSNTFTELSSEQIEILATAKDITKEELVTELMIKGYISYNLEIKQEKLEDLGREYPELFNKVDKKRIIDRNKEKDKKVRIRKENYSKIKELWEQLNQKYYLYFDNIEESILINTVSSVVKDDLIGKTVRTTERNTMEMVQGELFFNTTYETIEDMGNSNIPYGTFLKKVAERTNISIPIIHKGFVQASKSKEIESAFFTLDTVKSFEQYFKQRIYNEMLKIFSYKKLPNARVHPTQLTMNDGSPREFIQTSAYLGIKESSGTPLDTYLYDTVLWDSDIEENNIRNNIESVEVFGKIPRRTLKIPFIDGSTYSPDFMYIVKDQLNNTKLNLVIESKGIAKNKDLRFTEQDKIDSATKLYEVMKKEGIEVKFRTQTNNENIITIINDLIDK
ncbi:Type III restriction-modification system StyLTI enzyme res [Planococcus halocryophilus Or1]|nr:Type III restriction-modification system StyLTI enzyme res [Planococcus halocryophilus Or1]